jgi:hypothetical protein
MPDVVVMRKVLPDGRQQSQQVNAGVFYWTGTRFFVKSLRRPPIKPMAEICVSGWGRVRRKTRLIWTNPTSAESAWLV